MLNLNDIVSRIKRGLGYIETDTYEENIIKQELYDELKTVHRIVEDKRATIEIPVNKGDVKLEEWTITGGSVSDADPRYQYKVVKETTLGYIDSKIETVFVTTIGDIELGDLPQLEHGDLSVKILRTKDSGNVFYVLATITNNSEVYLDETTDEDLTELFTGYIIVEDHHQLSFPSDYYSLHEIVFLSIEKRIFFRLETTEEEFLRWSPNNYVEGQNIRSIMAGQFPMGNPLSEENFYLDGRVGYTLKNMIPVVLWFKPKFEGYIRYIYTQVPVVKITDWTASPDIVQAFTDVLVEGGILKGLKRKLNKGGLSQAEVEGLALAIRIATSSYKDVLKNYTGYAKKSVNTRRILPHDHLNDLSMNIQ